MFYLVEKLVIKRLLVVTACLLRKTPLLFRLSAASITCIFVLALFVVVFD